MLPPFAHVFSYLLDSFLSGTQPGWNNVLSRAMACGIVGAIFSTALFLGLHLSIGCSAVVSLSISLSIGITMAVLQFFSKAVRCFSILLLISCGMREGRNALITVGTGIVIFQNIKNIFLNLEGLANSITCTLEAKRQSIHISPLDNYIQAIRWIYKEAKLFNTPFPELVRVKDQFDVCGQVSDERMTMKLKETKQHIKSVAENLSAVLDMASKVGNMLLFATGIAIVVIGTGIFLRRYLVADNKKFQKTYITKHFVDLDHDNRLRGKPCILPLNRRERKKYILIPSLRLTCKEWKAVGLFFLPVFTNVSIWILLTAIDMWLYWLIFRIRTHLNELPGLKVPLSLSNTKGIHLDPSVIPVNRYEDPFTIHLVEHECIPTPTLSLSQTWIPLGVIIVALIIIGVFSATLIQLKLLVLAVFYPEKERERNLYLYGKLLKKRRLPCSKNTRKNISTLVKTRHFWFPILKMKEQIKKESEADPEENLP